MKQYCRALLRWLLLMIIFLGSCASDSTAQEGADPTQAGANGGQGAGTASADQPQFPSPATTPATKPFASPSAGKANANQKQSATASKDRLFFTLPNFLTVEDASHVQPLTAKQKFDLTARSSFDYGQYLWCAAVAGVSQAEDKEPGYGQGAEGYGKRFGAHLADNVIENFATGAVLPSLLHQDPRYFQLGKGSFLRRTGYAASRIFVTRTDSGGRQVNYSEIVGSGMASAISTYAYYPATDRNLGNVVSLWGSSMAYDSLGYVMKEFWPDIRRKLLHSKAAQSPQIKTP